MTRLEYPYSLSYQEINFTNVSESCIPAFASKTDEKVEPMKSDDTTSSDDIVKREKQWKKLKINYI